LNYSKKQKKKYKVVIDANVIISSIFGGYPEESVRLALNNVCVAPKLLKKELDKFVNTLKRKNKGNFKNTSEFFRYILSHITLIEPRKIFNISKDKNDNHYISVAIQEKAEFLVSGDNDILSVKEKIKSTCRILSPKEFVKTLKNRKG